MVFLWMKSLKSGSHLGMLSQLTTHDNSSRQVIREHLVMATQPPSECKQRILTRKSLPLLETEDFCLTFRNSPQLYSTVWVWW